MFKKGITHKTLPTAARLLTKIRPSKTQSYRPVGGPDPLGVPVKSQGFLLNGIPDTGLWLAGKTRGFFLRLAGRMSELWKVKENLTLEWVLPNFSISVL